MHVAFNIPIYLPSKYSLQEPKIGPCLITKTWCGTMTEKQIISVPYFEVQHNFILKFK